MTADTGPACRTAVLPPPRTAQARKWRSRRPVTRNSRGRARCFWLDGRIALIPSFPGAVVDGTGLTVATWGRGAPMTRGTMHRPHAIDASFDDTYEYDSSGAMVRRVVFAPITAPARSRGAPPSLPPRARARLLRADARRARRRACHRRGRGQTVAPLSTLLPARRGLLITIPAAKKEHLAGRGRVDAEGLPIQLSTGMLQALQRCRAQAPHSGGSAQRARNHERRGHVRWTPGAARPRM